MKSDKRPQVMSLELASVGFEDYKFKRERTFGVVEFERNDLPRPRSSARG